MRVHIDDGYGAVKCCIEGVWSLKMGRLEGHDKSGKGRDGVERWMDVSSVSAHADEYNVYTRQMLLPLTCQGTSLR